MNKSTNICNNCGKHGHMFHQCKLPITSYGIVAFKCGTNGIEYLMIRRKHSFGYIDFIRGKYSVHNLDHILIILDEMSVDEKRRINTMPFETLWKEMWGSNLFNNQYKNEEISSKKKFEALKQGITVEDKTLTLKDMTELSNTNWEETEWEFPKGRRNQRERDLDCAMREFEEETGINKTVLNVIENVLPFEEIFIGSNYKCYKHKYYLAYVHDFPEGDALLNFQETEVSKIEWKTFQDCLGSIRPYNLEKTELIFNINKVLQEYRLYS